MKREPTYTIVYTVLPSGSVDVHFYHNTPTGRISRTKPVTHVVTGKSWSHILPWCGAKDVSTHVFVRLGR